MPKRIIGIKRNGVPDYHFQIWNKKLTARCPCSIWASTFEEACGKLGWLPDDCEGGKITLSMWDYSGVSEEDLIRVHTCFYCGHVGGADEVIPGDYYDHHTGRDVFGGWVCKDQVQCFNRERLIKSSVKG